MSVYPFELALTFYFAAALFGVIEIIRGSRATSWLMMISAGLGFANHTVSILYRYAAAGHLPISSPHEAASFFAWSIMLLFFVLRMRYRIGLMGSFIMPVVFLLMLASSMLSRDIKPLSPTLQSYWLWIHTFLAFTGDAAFALAFVTGIMYLVQEHYLKSKHMGGLFDRLPSIQMLDYLNYRLITIGFPLMTLAIVTGALWADSAWGSYWRWDPREVWSLIIWFLYAIILHARLVAGWRGRRASVLSILGFLVIVGAFFGIKFFHKGLHIFP
ncbi:MAG: c-type cytochrome biogenesis protein CcsB [Nitrospirota bacterium]|jgi:cytochrome c-type biogenesis protein CcsB